jgi:hypothetical protein
MKVFSIENATLPYTFSPSVTISGISDINKNVYIDIYDDDSNRLDDDDNTDDLIIGSIRFHPYQYTNNTFYNPTDWYPSSVTITNGFSKITLGLSWK